MGMLVMDENRHLGDATPQSPTGNDRYRSVDLATMILRDRNHPSVIMWSMCNEEGLQGKPEGGSIFTAMMKEVHRHDATRPITCAMNAAAGSPMAIADVEDIVGVNYNVNALRRIKNAIPINPCSEAKTPTKKPPAANMRTTVSRHAQRL